jgi:hypothetical protein
MRKYPIAARPVLAAISTRKYVALNDRKREFSLSFILSFSPNGGGKPQPRELQNKRIPENKNSTAYRPQARVPAEGWPGLRAPLR